MGRYPLRKTRHIWLNGELVLWEDARIHVMSHVIHYGSGIFEGIRCYYAEPEGRPAIFRLGDHIRRFFESAKLYMMDLPFSHEALCEACREIVRANGLRECYIRPLAYRAYIEDEDTWGYIGLNPLRSPVHVAVIAFEFPSYGASAYRCITSSWTRIAPDILPPLAKASGQYINSQLALLGAYMVQTMADRAGLIPYDEAGSPEVSYEAILLDRRGFVSEGAGENIFIVKDGALHTPPTYSSILKGITRDSIVRIAKDVGYDVCERDITLSELYVADEVFMTGTAAEIKPVVEIDFRAIGDGKPGPVTEMLRQKYYDVVHGRDPKYAEWLTRV